jgi:hypothetical protein
MVLIITTAPDVQASFPRLLEHEPFIRACSCENTLSSSPCSYTSVFRLGLRNMHPRPQRFPSACMIEKIIFRLETETRVHPYLPRRVSQDGEKMFKEFTA